MKVLVISTWFPFPPDNGSKIRAYHLLNHLGRSHTLDLLALAQTERDFSLLDNIGEFCRRIAAFPEPQFHPEKVVSPLGFFSKEPRYFRAHHSPRMERKLDEWVKDECYDAAVAITLGAAPYVGKLEIPVRILDQHNVESQVIKRNCMQESSPLRRLRYAPTRIKAAKFEQAMCRNFDAITVVSEPERKLMEDLIGSEKSVHVIPNGADSSMLDYKSQPKEKETLIFTGALTYKPNFDAALRLCREILPMAQARRPNVKLKITGRTDGIDVKYLLSAKGVELTGYVDDIKPLTAAAAALAVPLTQGGGTRLKILEAMALGTPVVSTAMGAEGIDVRDGDNILLGDTNEKFAEHVLRLLEYPEAAGKLSENGRKLVKSKYLWDGIAEKFERILVEEYERKINASA